MGKRETLFQWRERESKMGNREPCVHPLSRRVGKKKHGEKGNTIQHKKGRLMRGKKSILHAS